MSIYIKGMEMPKDKEILCVNIYPDGKVCINLDLECKRIATAIPVQEHGDLIDTRPFDVLGFHNPEPGYENTFMDGVLWMEDKIDNAPVVIPADPEEEGDG